MAILVIPAGWRAAAGIDVALSCPAATVGEAVTWLLEAYPQFRPRVLNPSGQVAGWVNVFVDGRDIRDRDGLDTAAVPGSEIVFLPAMAGG